MGALGEEVAIQVDRGERTFAPGDRIMFLKNERSLGVKNGTLGVLEAVAPERLAVRLDDGRRVAFDLKDYAHLDHGYAATIHKAQGVTIDRAHVLATPGIDRHAAYVGMSRHRDQLDVHYAREDFADRDALVRTLSRDRAKDMASDYADTFAERRGWERPGRGKATPSPEPVPRPGAGAAAGGTGRVPASRASGLGHVPGARGRPAAGRVGPACPASG